MSGSKENLLNNIKYLDFRFFSELLQSSQYLIHNNETRGGKIVFISVVQSY